MKMTESQKVAAAAWRIRRYALQMGEVQGQGYIGQALGYADVLATAFSHAMTYRPEDPEWEGRDRFPALSWPLRYRLLCRAAGGGHYPGSRTGNLRLRRQPPADVRHDDLHPGDGDVRRARWGRDCPLPSAWRLGCGRNRARPGSTTPCPMGSWTKGRPGRRRCRRLTMA
ncbi:transketolase [Klebsiella pneumoniae]|uniref:Transketolase n=1 Tax=Klebsiella pneumoniae TaxID=573 RepID=A0A377XP12_KLEPN|nr:transketolase [Klebsiella pneumoniae]